ncbi:hypothetical protein D3C75_1083470 [compost metagenome]
MLCFNQVQLLQEILLFPVPRKAPFRLAYNGRDHKLLVRFTEVPIVKAVADANRHNPALDSMIDMDNSLLPA